MILLSTWCHLRPSQNAVLSEFLRLSGMLVRPSDPLEKLSQNCPLTLFHLLEEAPAHSPVSPTAPPERSPSKAELQGQCLGG